MKRFIKYISLFLVIFILTVACNKNDSKKNEENKYLISINYEEFNEKLANEDTFILEVVQTTCSNCTAFTPKFTKVLSDYKITAYSLNLTDMNYDDKNEFLQKYDVDGTPTVMFIENGQDTSTMRRLVGNQNESKIISKLKSNGYIKEDE